MKSLFVAVGLLALGSCQVPPPGGPSEAYVACVVTDAATTRGIADATCTLGAFSGQTNADGYFEFRAIPPGPYRFTATADGYVPASGDYQIAAGNQPPITVALTAAVARRRGVTRLDGFTFRDDDGLQPALGFTLFAGGWAYLHDRGRLEQNLEVLASAGVDWVRVLVVVGPQHWTDRTVTPADTATMVPGFTDLAYDKYGIRTQWTIFGGIDTTPTPSSREALVRQVADLLAPRAAKVQYVEVANEAWQNGFDGDDGRAEAKRLASILKARLPNLVAVTAPQEATAEGVSDWYDGSPANVVALHLERNTSGTGLMWRPVRQAWEMPFASPDLGRVNQEPIGPQSSVSDDDDPLRLTMAAALTWLSGGAGYVLHTGAGVRLGGREDVALRRPANVWQVSRIAETFAGLRSVRALLPDDLPNWQRHNTNRNYPNTPFANVDQLQALVDSGQLLRMFSATKGGRIVAMPIVAKADIPMVFKWAVHLKVHDPMTGALRQAVDVDAGGPFTLPATDAAILLAEPR